MDIERIRGVIAGMKLQEKLSLIGGGTSTPAINRLNIPAIDFGEGILPYSVEEPTALALGCTFSTTLCQAISKARSVEAARSHRAFGGEISCGLMTDPMRPDACDFFSEDAYLTSELLTAYAAAGVVGYVFTDALGQGRYANRTVDGRALKELYLYPLAVAGKYCAALQLDGGYLNGEKVSTSRAVCDMFASYIPNDAMFITQSGCGGGLDGVTGSGAYQLNADGGDKKEISRAVINGTVFENKLNSCIERTLSTAAKVHEFYKKPFNRSVSPCNIVIDSTVLLKNDGVLPTSVRNITIFGDPDAFDDSESFRIQPVKDALKKCGLFNLFLITDYGEDGIDETACEAVSAACTVGPTVVVLCGGAATELPFESSVNAILYCPYCPSVAAVIAMLTNTSPRGHLPFTWLRKRSSYPRNNVKYNDRGDFRYESLYNGYRLFNNFKSDVLYPFGHGLDYASYEISRFGVSCDKLKISAEFVIKNTGEFAGSALCQVYLTLQSGAVYGLSKRLVAFKRVALEATENTRVSFEIDLNEFKVYDEENDSYSPVGGKYRVDIGLSSTDIRASGEIKVPAGSRVNAGLAENLAPTYYKSNSGAAFDPSAPEIERLLKVPFIKKPDEYADILPPEPSKIKKAVKHAEKTVSKRLYPLVRYKIEKTPLN